MDIGTLIGLLAGFGLIIGSIFIGGSLGAFIDLPSIFIVIGGTLSVTFIMFPMGTVFGAIKVAMKAFFAKPINANEIISQITSLAEVARKDGLVALEKASTDIEFLKKGCILVADGNNSEVVRSVLEIELAFMQQRHTTGQDIFKSMGSMSPAFGMIGTLIGLVQMLQTLDDPSSIGPAMAVALLTTFYGAVLANVAFIPIAKKLEERSKEETLYMEIIIEGIVSIANGEHPAITKEKLLAFLAPALREKK
ncbi:MotA/TolQ/ExbB proton channel family protein [Desulfothermus naphthae]